MDYWVNMSKGIWADKPEERDKECEWTQSRCPLIHSPLDTDTLMVASCGIVQHVYDHTKEDGLPCFYQADLLVRSLIHDEAVGYVPPFIVFQQRDTAHGTPTCLLPFQMLRM